jgi:acetyl-CoA carboxylase biotin carboxyl carrier protein
MSGEQERPVDAQPDGAGVPDGAGPAEPAAPGDPGTRGRRSRPAGGAAGADGASDASLLALIDRLSAVLERSELGELEVGVGGTTIILRSPAAIERTLVPGAGQVTPAPEPADPAAPSHAGVAPAIPAPAAGAADAKPSVKAPLTGIYYGAPSPGAMAYVAVGDHVSVGQIIGLIEAMKLFNEIKSDLAGRVTRICAENGQLVKARQPLIEVERA